MSNSVQSRNSVQHQREQIGEAVRVARARKRLSQVQVAAQAGVSPVRVSQLENGEADPRFSTMSRIADVLDLRITIESAA